MRVRAFLSALLLAIPVVAQSQDTTAMKGYIDRTRKDLVDTISRDNSRPAYTKRAQVRGNARLDSALTAMRKPVKPDTVVPVPPTPVVATLEIVAADSTVAVGGTLQLYGVPKDSAGNTLTTPVGWTATPLSIGTVSGTGLLTGVAPGVVNVAAVSNGKGALRAFTVTGVSPPDTVVQTDTAKFDNGAELPKDVPNPPIIPTCAVTVRVLPGTDLQAAINSASSGTCLLLAPGSAFTTSSGYNLPNKGASTAWITIQTEAGLPTLGTRMTPTQAASLKLAKVLASAYTPVFRTLPGAHHYYIRGIEFGSTPAAQLTGVNMILDFRDATGSGVSGLPHDMWLVQNYIHGTPTLDSRRAVFADFRNGGAVDNWIADIHSNGSDSQCWLPLSGARNQLFRNNHCEAGHELFMSGGGSTPDSTFNPSDIAVIGNHFIRPASWKGVWQAKNLIETKNVRRMLVEGNVMENSWADAQAGFCFVLKSENQNNDSPWTTSSDITIRYNIIKKCANGFNIAELGSNGTPALPSSRFSIHDNLIDSVGKFGGTGIAMQNLNSTRDIKYNHNTFMNGLQGMPSNTAVTFDGTAAVRLGIDSSAMGHGSYGVKGAGTTEGTPTLLKFAPGGTFTYNAIIGGCATYPATNTCPASLSAVSPGIGADLARINAMTSGVVVNDLLSARRATPHRSQLKYGIPVTDPKCHDAATHPLEAFKCDVVLKP